MQRQSWLRSRRLLYELVHSLHRVTDFITIIIIMCNVLVSVKLFTVVSGHTERLHAFLFCFDVSKWRYFHFVILLVVTDAEFC